MPAKGRKKMRPAKVRNDSPASVIVIGAGIAETWQALLFAQASLMGARDFASPSMPVVGTPFWHAVS
jgi:hypothetical protein